MRWRVVFSALGLLATCGCWSGPGEGNIDMIGVESAAIEPVSERVRFASIRDIALTPGSLWVLDGAPPFVTRIDSVEGAAVQAGQRGEGPGEYLFPVAIQAVADAEEPGAWIWDLANLRVSFLDTLGALKGSEPIGDDAPYKVRGGFRNVSYADPFRIRQQGGKTFYTFFRRRLDRTGDLVSGSLRRSDHRLDIGIDLVLFSDHMDGEVPPFKEWTAVPLWDACDGTVVVWSPSSGRVIWLDRDGTERGSVDLNERPTPVQLDDIQAYLRRMARLELGPDFEAAGIDFAGLARASRDRFVDSHPGPTDIRCEPYGAAWLRLFDTTVDPLGKGRTWVRVSVREDPIKYSFPEEFIPFVFTAEGAYGVLERPDGYQLLAWWRRDPRP